jgi:hypothetical protein
MCLEWSTQIESQSSRVHRRASEPAWSRATAASDSGVVATSRSIAPSMDEQVLAVSGDELDGFVRNDSRQAA